MHVRSIYSLVLFLAGAPFLAVHAEGLTVHLTPFATFRTGGEFQDATTGVTRSIDSHAGLAFALGFTPNESAQQYELFYSRQETQIGGHQPFDIDIEYIHVGGTYDYGEEYGQESERFIPYVAGGIGATRMTPHGPGLERESHWSLSLGGGVKMPLSQRFLVRLELRGYFTFLNSDSTLFCVSANGSASCAFRAKGNGFFQGEALAGMSFRF